MYKVKINVYDYDELSDSAKEKAKENYLASLDKNRFEQFCMCSIGGKGLFDGKFGFQYTMDGDFNVFGFMTFGSFFNYIVKYSDAYEMLTQKEVYYLIKYKYCIIEIPKNNSGQYSIAKEFKLDEYMYSNIDMVSLGILEECIRRAIEDLNELFSRYTKKFFNRKPTDVEMGQICDVNKYKFLQDGRIFVNPMEEPF